MKTAMLTRLWPQSSTSPWYALAVILLVLAVQFLSEYAIMAVLPYFWHETAFVPMEAVFDAGVLTMTTAPVLWWLLVRPLRHLAVSRQRLLKQLLVAQEDERRRIARDLHDEIGQSITSILVGLKTLRADEKYQEGVGADRLDTLCQVASKTHEEVRRLARGLRPVILEHLGLATALERLGEEFSEIHGVDVRVDVRLSDLELADPMELAIYRIAQEALSNTARHAEAKHVHLGLETSGPFIELTIQDDGSGFPVDDSLQDDPRETALALGLGVDGIIERARLLGGYARVHSSTNRGTTVEVQLPIMGGGVCRKFA